MNKNFPHESYVNIQIEVDTHELEPSGKAKVHRTAHHKVSKLLVVPGKGHDDCTDKTLNLIEEIEEFLNVKAKETQES